jgi:hypothetical protein
LELFTVDEAIAKFSAWTLPTTKEMLGAENAPSIDDLRALPKITVADKNPGVYLIIVSTPADPTDNAGYLGESAAYPKGVVERTLFEHLSKAYRDRQFGNDKKRPHLYNYMDKAGMNRQAVPYKLAIGEFQGPAKDGINLTRTFCQLLESIFMAWMRFLEKPDSPENGLWAHCTPWTSGTIGLKKMNKQISVRQFIWQTKLDGLETQEEKNERMNDARKEAVAALPPGHQSMDKERNRLRDELIGRPIKKMKAAGASEEAIEAFRAEKTKVLDKLAPLGSTVHGGGRKKKNWRKIEAEAKRTQEALDDDEELPVEKPRAKRQRTRVSKDARKPVVNDAESQVVVDDEDLTLLESGAADPECEAAEGADDEDDIIFLGHTMKRSLFNK